MRKKLLSRQTSRLSTKTWLNKSIGVQFLVDGTLRQTARRGSSPSPPHLLSEVIMNSMKVELAIILTLLAVSIFTLVNAVVHWVPDVYGIAGMNLLILAHVLWMRKYGDKT
jgi:hypothetical protein